MTPFSLNTQGEVTLTEAQQKIQPVEFTPYGEFLDNLVRLVDYFRSPKPPIRVRGAIVSNLTYVWCLPATEVYTVGHWTIFVITEPVSGSSRYRLLRSRSHNQSLEDFLKNSIFSMLTYHERGSRPILPNGRHLRAVDIAAMKELTNFAVDTVVAGHSSAET